MAKYSSDPSIAVTMTPIMLSPSSADAAGGFHRLHKNKPQTSGDVSQETANVMRSPMEQAPFLGRNSTTEDEKYREHSPLVLFGYDLSEYDKRTQFFVCAGGVFLFTLLYGYLQELLSVTLFNRDLALFFSALQFFAYAFWSYILHAFVNQKSSPHAKDFNPTLESEKIGVPMKAYVGIAIVRALDMALTNSAMRFINYPAKTLIKSSRVIFTMLIGVVVSRKRYSLLEYFQVVCMVIGLVIFLHADASRAAVFQPVGVLMLVLSLTCDGFITNWSEIIMRKYHVGQDEYIYRLYSIALVAISFATQLNGEISRGLYFLSVPGTLDEVELGKPPTWSCASKLFLIILFGTTGFFGSSAAAAITKHFGALPMSLTSVARKATTLFLSFALFGNDCSFEHIAGMFMFVSALLMKAMGKGMKRANGILPPLNKESSLSMVKLGDAENCKSIPWTV